MAAVPLLAQMQNKAEFSATGSHFFGTEIVQFTAITQDGTVFHPTVRLLDATTYGARFGYLLSREIEPEIEWFHAGTNLFYSGGAPTGPGVTSPPVTLDYFLAGLSYNLTEGPVRPYAAASAGALRFEESLPAYSQTKFAAALGFGVKFFVLQHLALRVEGRALASAAGENFLGSIHGTTLSKTKSWLINGQLGGGLVLGL